MLPTVALCLVIVISGLATGCAAPTPGPKQSVEERYNDLYSLSLNPEHLSQMGLAEDIKRSYEAKFADLGDVERQDAASADFLFRASYVAVFYTREAVGLEMMSAALERLESLGSVKPQHYSDMLSAYVITREFARATALSSSGKTPADRPVPFFVDDPTIPPDTATEWLVHPGKNELRRQAFQLSDAPMVVVVSSPKCGFSRQAFVDISSDPELGAPFLAHAEWISPVEGKIDVAAFQAWNASNPSAPISIAHAHRDFPFVDHWATPTFYFLKHGQVVAKVVGWPKGGRKKEIAAGMERAGIAIGQ